MTHKLKYLLDSDVFITAKNTYYAFDICPGFWESLLHHHSRGTAFSIDRVRSELLAGSRTEDLVKWVRQAVPNSFFLLVEDDLVPTEYTKTCSGHSDILVTTTLRRRDSLPEPTAGWLLTRRFAGSQS